MTTVIVLPPTITIIIVFDSQTNHNNDKDNYYHKENNDLDKKTLHKLLGKMQSTNNWPKPRKTTKPLLFNNNCSNFVLLFK